MIWIIGANGQTSGNLCHAARNSVLVVIVRKELEMTSSMKIEVENIKCGGCERSILKGLTLLDGISDVVVDRDRQTIQFSGPAQLRLLVTEKLRAMGYREKASLHGLDAGLANARSFVSCAIGHVS